MPNCHLKTHLGAWRAAANLLAVSLEFDFFLSGTPADTRILGSIVTIRVASSDALVFFRNARGWNQPLNDDEMSIKCLLNVLLNVLLNDLFGDISDS